MAGRFRSTPNAPQKLKAEADARAVLALRIKGLSYSAIAEQLNCSRSYAHSLVDTAAKELRESNRNEAAALVDIELARLDAMLAALNDKINGGDTRAIDSALKIMERRAKLLGLDKPQKLEHSGAVMQLDPDALLALLDATDAADTGVARGDQGEAQDDEPGAAPDDDRADDAGAARGADAGDSPADSPDDAA